MKARVLAGIVWLSICCAVQAQTYEKSDWKFIKWKQSYKAGHNDRNGEYLGGSQMMHLVPYRGKLFAALSYWEDQGCLWYGKEKSKGRWAQILRLDKPNDDWALDIQLPESGLRPEILTTLTFRTDGEGKRLERPATFLVTCCSFVIGPDRVGLKCFARDDETGKWHESLIMTGPGFPGESYSVRDLNVYRDKVTGVDMAFTTIGRRGIFSGVYDPDAPGLIRWNAEPEMRLDPTKHYRPLAIVEANNTLIFPSGKWIYRRVDGPNPTYVEIADLTDLYQPEIMEACGGVRGLTTIKNPNGRGDSLLFVWVPGIKDIRGDVYRLDPAGKNTYTRHKEVCLADLVSTYLGGTPVYFVLAAYNDFMPIKFGREVEHIVGMECLIPVNTNPSWRSRAYNPAVTWYRGAVFAIRNKNQEYRIEEVGGRKIGHNDPPLITVVDTAISPFRGENAVYFCGLDPNQSDATNRAWIYKGIFKPGSSARTSFANEPYRKWISRKGTAIEAKLTRMSSSTVVLQKRNGKPITIKASSLSTKDQRYLKSKQ